MSYGQGLSTSSSPNTILSLVEDTGGIRTRLRELYERMTTLGASLHGAEPREVEKSDASPEPPPSVRGNIEFSKRLLTRIEDELQRIASRV